MITILINLKYTSVWGKDKSKWLRRMSDFAFYSLALEVESMVSQSISSLSGLVFVVCSASWNSMGAPKVMSDAERFNTLTTSLRMETRPTAQRFFIVS